jgi:tetratricopeptide (TPR) repeat protein
MIKKYLLVFILLVVSAEESFAQNLTLIDSLKKVAAVSTGEKRFDALNTLGFEFRLSYPDSTIYYCQQAYDLGSELNLKKNLARPLSFMGLAKKFNNDYKGALYYHTKAIEVAEQQRDSSSLGFCYNNFGRLYFDQGDISRAYDSFLKSKEVFEAIRDQSGLAYGVKDSLCTGGTP